MDIASDPRPVHPAGSANPATSISPTGAIAGGQFDWHGLRARLGAVHGLRGALAASDVHTGSGYAGSFAPHAARMLASYAHPIVEAVGESFHAVNLTTLADRKAVSGISRVVAGLNAPGTEG